MEKFLLNQNKNSEKVEGKQKLKVYDKEGLFLYCFDNLEMTANFFNVNKHIIKYRLNTSKSFILPFAFGEKEVYFKRSISL